MPSAAENIELVKIRATYKVAIISTLCYSCIFVKFVGYNISRHFRCTQDNFKLSQVVPVVVTKIDTLIDLGVKCLEGTTERSDGNRVRSARIGEARTMCLEFSCKRAQSRTCSGYAECSRKSRRSGTTPQDIPHHCISANSSDRVGRTNCH